MSFPNQTIELQLQLKLGFPPGCIVGGALCNRDRKRELWNDQIPKGSYRIHGGNWISGIMGISWVYHGIFWYIMVHHGIHGDKLHGYKLHG